MLTRLQQTIQRYANGRTVLVLLCIFALLLITVNVAEIPFGVRPLTAHAGGLHILDLRTSYTPDEAYTLFQALGAEGRRLYCTSLLTGDIFVPLVGFLFLSICITWLAGLIVTPAYLMQRLILLPLVLMAADYAENVSILTMLLAFPRRLDGIAQIANFFTMLKCGAGILTIIVIITCATILAWRWIARRSVGGDYAT